MSESADVVIIGGGIVVSSIAWHLTDAGCRNVVLLTAKHAIGLERFAEGRLLEEPAVL